MPARVVRGEINGSRSLSRVSLFADLTFRALVVAVDDYGRFDADPLMLKAALFPRRPEVTAEQLTGWLVELVREGCVRLYSVEGAEYLVLTGWDRHRGNSRRASSSRFPAPPDAEEEMNDAPGASRKSGSFPEIREMRGNPSENRESGSEKREALGERGSGGARNAPAADAASPPTDPPEAEKRRKAPRGKTQAPDDLDPEQKRALLAWVRAKEPDAEPELRALVDACLDHFRASGGLKADWVATCRTWIRNRKRFTARGEAKTFAERKHENTVSAVVGAVRLLEGAA